MRWPALFVLVGLSGCQAVSDVAALGAGASAGTLTGNPAIGYAVGVGTQAGLRELTKYVSRRRQQGEQDAIADAAGAAPLGAMVPWEIRHTIPFGDERGQLAVAREYVTPIATCREVIFTVVEDDGRGVFTTSLCRQAERWKWSTAEPTTERWGYLQ